MPRVETSHQCEDKNSTITISARDCHRNLPSSVILISVSWNRGMRSWIGLLMFLVCPLKQKSSLALIPRNLLWGNQQLITCWEGLCTAMEALLMEMVHGLDFECMYACRGGTEKHLPFKKYVPFYDTLELHWCGSLTDRLNSTLNEGATPLVLVKSPSTLVSLWWQSCDKGKLQEKQVPLGMNPVYKQGRIAEQMICKAEAN